MIYSHVRENEKTDRFEVRIIPGYGCTLTPGAGNAVPTWLIARAEEPYWVDLEGELNRILHRAEADYGLKSDGSAATEFLERINIQKAEMYDLGREDSFISQDYLAQLALLNVAEYFRLLKAKELAERELVTTKKASADHATMRSKAFDFDVAELAEWLISHGIGIPDVVLFQQAPLKEAAAEAAADGVMPAGLRYSAELYRLHQATEKDLLRFVDQVQHALGLDTPRAAIERMQAEVLPWIDVTSFEQRYESFKKEQAIETARAQAALLRQHLALDKRPRRGSKQGSRVIAPAKRIELRNNEEELSPLEEFTQSIELDEPDPYEAAMDRALQMGEGSEFGYVDPEDGFIEDRGAGDENFVEAEAEPFSGAPESELFGEGDFAPQYEEFGRPPYANERYAGEPYPADQFGPVQQGPPRPQGRGKRPRPKDRGRGRGPRPNGPTLPEHSRHVSHAPHHAAAQHPVGKSKKKRPIKEPRPMPPGNNRSIGRGPDFDSVQPFSNASPGLPPTGPIDPAAARAKRKWKPKH